MVVHSEGSRLHVLLWSWLCLSKLTKDLFQAKPACEFALLWEAKTKLAGLNMQQEVNILYFLLTPFFFFPQFFIFSSVLAWQWTDKSWNNYVFFSFVHIYFNCIIALLNILWVLHGVRSWTLIRANSMRSMALCYINWFSSDSYLSSFTKSPAYLPTVLIWCNQCSTVPSGHTGLYWDGKWNGSMSLSLHSGPDYEKQSR